MKTATTIIVLLLTEVVLSQRTFDNKPDIGPVYSFSMTPNETLWMCSDNEILSYNSRIQKWYNWDAPKTNGTLRHIDFFNDNIGIVYGYNSGLIFRTINGGKSWEEIQLPDHKSHMWINSSVLQADGTGILCSTYYLFKTTDFGQTWKTLAEVPRNGPDESPCTLLMTNDKAYFISCQLATLKMADIYFSKIETGTMPSDQGLVKLKKSANNQSIGQLVLDSDGQTVVKDISNEIHSEVKNIEEISNRLFILQGGKIFYSKSKSMKWKPLSNLDFIRMTSDGKNIFAISKDLKIYEINRRRKIKLFNSNTMTFTPWQFKAAKNALYILDMPTGKLGIVTKEKVLYK